MSRQVKRITALAALVIAFSAAQVSSATAGVHFLTDISHASFAAEAAGNQVFALTGGTNTCKKISANATTSTTTFTEMTLENLTYSECTMKTIFGTINTTVSANGCDFNFTSEEGTPVHLQCPAGKGPVAFEGPGCKITMAGGQTPVGLFPTNGASDITFDVLLTKITSTATGAFCSDTGTSSTGTYNGAITVRGSTTSGESTKLSWG